MELAKGCLERTDAGCVMLGWCCYSLRGSGQQRGLERSRTVQRLDDGNRGSLKEVGPALI